VDLSPDVAEPPVRRRWTLAALLGVALAFLYSAVSTHHGALLTLAFCWGPAAAIAIMAYLLLGRTKLQPGAAVDWSRAITGVAILAAIVIPAVIRPWRPGRPDDLDALTAIHLPALAWLVLGWVILGPRAGTRDVFASVLASVEAVVTAGLMAGAGIVFSIITYALFHAIGIDLPNALKRFMFYGGPGLLPVAAVATVYDPDRPPEARHGGHGLGRIVFTVGRLFLPLTLLVLAVYVIAIPFRFMEPFRNRDTLIIFNAMLFAVIALIVIATPLRPGSVAPRHELLLRRGIVSVAVLALLVSLYAMAAVLYRASQGGLTMNRLTVIGWNALNIATLAWLVALQARVRGDAWIEACHRAFRAALAGYALWTGFVLAGIPLIWRDRW
jgi:hypothetical protein